MTNPDSRRGLGRVLVVSNTAHTAGRVQGTRGRRPHALALWVPTALGAVVLFCGAVLGTVAAVGIETAGATTAVVLHVATGRTGTSCTSSAPCGSIQTAVTYAQATYGASDAVTITVGSGTYDDNVTIDASGLALLTIAGSGPASTTVNGQGHRVFTVGTGTVTISGLKITGGRAADGGGVENTATLTLANDILTNDSAPLGFGGGVQSYGNLTLANDTLTHDSATFCGGLVTNSSTVLTNVSFSNDSATAGGALCADSATVVLDPISYQSAETGGGLYSGGGTFLSDQTPTNVQATAGDGGATVSFTPPADAAESTITGYTVRADDLTHPTKGGQTASGTTSPITVPGLTNGDTYTFTATTSDALPLTSVASAATSQVTPAAVTPTLSATTSGSAVPYGGGVHDTASLTGGVGTLTGTVTFTAYLASTSSCTAPQFSYASTVPVRGGSATSAMLFPASPGTYKWGVVFTSTNPDDTSIPLQCGGANETFAVDKGVPGPPTTVHASAGNGEATVTWDAPATAGGTPVTGYTVTSTPGASTCSPAALSDLTCKVTGLTNGMPYTFTVTARNGQGAGPASSASAAVVAISAPPAGKAMGTMPTGKGWWIATSTGAVSAYGTAASYGSMATKPLNAPVVGIAATTSGKGYWEVAADGGVFSFGDATFHGSMAGMSLDQPVVGIAADPKTGGYWEVAADGGVFAFGAPFYGSMGGKPLDAPIVGMAAMPTGGGYWLVAKDGGVFAFGAAGFHGSMGGKPLREPMVALAQDPATGGYWEVGSDGGVFAFTAPFYGSEGATPPAARVAGLAVTPAGTGYTIVDGAGTGATYGS